MPPCRKARSRTHRMEASSSTSHTLRGLVGIWSMEWQQNSESGQTWTALKLDEAVMTADEILPHCKPQSGSVYTPPQHRAKEGVAQMFGNTWAVVFELHARNESITPRADVFV